MPWWLYVVGGGVWLAVLLYMAAVCKSGAIEDKMRAKARPPRHPMGRRR